MKAYRPIISLLTGFWGGEWVFLAPSERDAFRMLRRRIAYGKVKWTPHEQR
ncbi:MULTISPECIES: hypothetical protein [unclassified Bradyrhizobium]|uniref:hypothetical protein n=1 Tax=unclassified Bradyrhizobium TaxID=2631580 RepID=UPI0029164613|nr:MULTISPECIES: hypothetical protein [unclassified Bradyrhizobium]